MQFRSLTVRVQYEINRLFYFLLRISLQVKGTQHARTWIANHPHYHWLRFPWDLRKTVCYSRSLDAWFEVVDYETVTLMNGPPDFPEDWIALKAGDIFMDVGAHVGYYTILAARCVGSKGRVIAVEPCTENYHALSRNVTLNGFENVLSLCVAAWSRTSLLPVAINESFSSMHAVVESQVKEKRHNSYVMAAPIDKLFEDLGLSRVDWIKIDVEGAEAEVLNGAKQVVAKYHPQLLLEIHCTRNVIEKMLGELGYDVIASKQDTSNSDRSWLWAKWGE